VFSNNPVLRDLPTWAKEQDAEKANA